MEPVILFRTDWTTEEEFRIAEKYFPVVKSRSLCKNQIVIGRYSCLPFYRELEEDLKYNDCKLVNSYEQHRWIANFDYYNVLKDYTFETWDDTNFCFAPEGEYVVKGRTNSRKFQFKKMMYAPNKRIALEIACELINNDPMILEQGIIYRKYVPLKTFEIGMNGLPFSSEYRLFFFGDRELCNGYYWSLAENAEKYETPDEGIIFAKKIATIVSEYTKFFVLDIAEKEAGGWVLVEINDGGCSGLSMCNPGELYKNLFDDIKISIDFGYSV